MKSIASAAVTLGADHRIQVRCETPHSVTTVGWQIFDPETDLFIEEGEWVRTAGNSAEITVRLPASPGRYRIYVSQVDEVRGWDYQRGRRFLVVDAEVSGASVRLLGSRIATLRSLRRQKAHLLLKRAFLGPYAAIASNWSLIRSMVRRDIGARYRGSFGDVLWTVLHPLLLMVTYYFVFGVVLQARFLGDPSRAGFVLYFLAGMLPWLAFSEPAGRAPNVIVDHRNFVKKLVFPVEILPVTHVISGLVTAAFAMGVFLVGLLAARGTVPMAVLWLPAILIPQLLLTLGSCWALAAVGVFARDLGQINGFLLTLLFFLTPICYPESSLPPAALGVLRKNPMYVLVRGYRTVFLEGTPPPLGPTWKLWIVSILICAAGYLLFHKLRKSFPDVI
jgi:lipopolysaccharide transport system permease protein